MGPTRNAHVGRTATTTSSAVPPAGPLSYLICLIRALYELRAEVRSTGVHGKVRCMSGRPVLCDTPSCPVVALHPEMQSGRTSCLPGVASTLTFALLFAQLPPLPP